MSTKEQLEKWKNRPISWSQLSSWEWSKEEWYKKYILDEPYKGSPETDFGSRIGKKLETDPTFLPMIPRYKKMEHEFRVNIGGLTLVGFLDTFCTVTNKKIGEFKTGVKKYDQKRVDDMGQITMYCLLNYITNKVNPEETDIFVAWMPTKRKETGNFEVVIEFVDDIENNIKIFKTKRTMVDILKFAAYIKKTHKAMQAYAKKYGTK